MSRLSRHIVPVLVVVVVVVVVLVSLTGCQEQQLTHDENACLTFSADTISFDTVFTSIGSSTRTVMVYNPNDNAVSISRIWWQRGQCFFASIDGENNPNHWQDITLYGGDSLYLFIRTEIDPYGQNSHPVEYDTLYFEVNGHRQYIAMQAYGMDVTIIRTPQRCTVYNLGQHFRANKPYLIYDTLYINGRLTIDAGATLYMHQSAQIYALGSVTAKGTATQPIRIMGDRTDYLFPHVPYRVASGQWGGIYLFRFDTICGASSLTYDLQHVHLLSGQVGLFCYSDNPAHRATLHLHNARIHNMSAYGLVLENTDATVSNTEISNCAAYGMYLCGGDHRIEHSSVANFYGYPYTTLNIHNTPRQEVAAVYILAQDHDMAPSHSYIYNSIITGAVQPALVVDSIPSTGFQGCIAGCYLRCDSDSATASWGHSNTYAMEGDTVFKNTYYKYGEYLYYDFHLSEHSAARQIGLPLDSLHLDIQQDMEGQARDAQHPDAGCYTYR